MMEPSGLALLASVTCMLPLLFAPLLPCAQPVSPAARLSTEKGFADDVLGKPLFKGAAVEAPPASTPAGPC